MSSGSAAIPLLKAAPEADQVADRLDGGDWRGLELCLAPAARRDDEALDAAIEVGARRRATRGCALTAECPVAWPSGAFVRVDRLDDEARARHRGAARVRGRRSASPVLTIHLFVPMTPDEYRAHGALDEAAVEEFLALLRATPARREGVTPLIENVPPGAAHAHRAASTCRRSAATGATCCVVRAHRGPAASTFDTSHAALFAHFAAAYPSLFGLASDDELELERYVEELRPADRRRARLRRARRCSARACRTAAASWTSTRSVRRLGETGPLHRRRDQRARPRALAGHEGGLPGVERALAAEPAAGAARSRAAPAARRTPSTGRRCVGRRDPVPSVLELQERFGGRRVLITGRRRLDRRPRCASLLLGFRPERVTLLDAHEASLTADRRGRTRRAARGLRARARRHPRRRPARAEAVARARPDVIFHLAAYKHVDWAETHPGGVRRHEPAGQLERAARRRGGGRRARSSSPRPTRRRWPRASTGARSASWSSSPPTRRAQRGGTAARCGSSTCSRSAGSASELFLRQARAGVPLTVTDTGMMRYWITGAHAALAARPRRAAGRRAARCSPTPHDPAELSVGELAERIWRAAGAGETPTSSCSASAAARR